MVATAASCQFKPGQSGNPNGRPRGSKNKIRFDAAEILKNEGCNPFKILAQIALGNPAYNKGEPIGAYTRKDAASELCSYVLPKLKAVELSTAQKENISLLINCKNETQVEKRFVELENEKENNE